MQTLTTRLLSEQSKILIQEAISHLRKTAIELFSMMYNPVGADQAGHCGYINNAMTIAMRNVFGRRKARTVYGHCRASTETEPEHHYWSQYNGRIYVDAAHPMFPLEQPRPIIVAPYQTGLQQYSLEEYKKGGSDDEDRTLRWIKQNRGTLNTRVQILHMFQTNASELIATFEHLVNTIEQRLRATKH